MWQDICSSPFCDFLFLSLNRSTNFIFQGPILSINCHERMDASDFLGSIRPLNAENGYGFRWQDGIIVQAMRQGQLLLIDEINLAPDSVLERLNSVLEPNRSILLTDAGSNFSMITADSAFRIAATMNPGNDHGKKEVAN